LLLQRFQCRCRRKPVSVSLHRLAQHLDHGPAKHIAQAPPAGSRPEDSKRFDKTARMQQVADDARLKDVGDAVLTRATRGRAGHGACRLEPVCPSPEISSPRSKCLG